MSDLVNLGDLVQRGADPHTIAWIDCHDDAKPRDYTHGHIDAAANAVARGLVAWGAQRGDRIAILSANRAAFLKPVVDRVLPLPEAAEALRLLEDREVIGKVIVEP